MIEAHKALGIELPVNLLMCFEGMEESGSEGLDELIEAEKDKFFKDADAVCISDNYWYAITRRRMRSIHTISAMLTTAL